ncbi:Hpt domain-containing protein [Litoribacillus peritrichatus]|uniref:Hpt domain-containing protein n=1 Tax=Litoribacillus peritrichatus TaxID=718191 RepID=A0ABP7M5W7_9GAMM
MTELQHLDLDALSELKDVMEDEFQSLIETFIVDAERKLAAFRVAIDSGNADEVGKVSHSFKGSCSNIGAPYLSSLCKQTEDKGRENDLSGVESLYSGIESEYLIVKELLIEQIN